MENRQVRREQRLRRRRNRRMIIWGIICMIPAIILVFCGMSVYTTGQQPKEQSLMEHNESKREIDPEKPMVAITYDDGPGFEAEDRILQSLEEHDSVATFFYTGCRVKDGEEKIRKAHAIGCEMGSHTWDHPELTKLTEKELAKQMKRTDEAIKKVCGAYPTVFRPSYGITDDRVNSAAGKPVIMWSVDTMDWRHRNGQTVFEQITKEGDLDGKIILMHSIYDSTADATELLLPWLRDQGYQTVTVTELIRHRDGTEPQKGVVYR